MAADPESSVRRAVAAHPRLPIPSLITLLADQSEWVARAAVSPPSLAVTDMERLLTLARLLGPGVDAAAPTRRSGFAVLIGRQKTLRHTTTSPRRTGDIVAATLHPTHFECRYLPKSC